jgi:DNA polymerase epsilon subunit 2
VSERLLLPGYRTRIDMEETNRTTKGISLAPPATSKARYLRDRFNIIKQVILRDEHFAPPAVIGDERVNYMKVCVISIALCSFADLQLPCL